MRKTRTIEEPRGSQGDQDRRAAVMDARRAARMAAEIARVSTGWSALAGAGADDAGEAVRAAWRARDAAQRAERAETLAEAIDCARLAWAAATSGAEADARVVTAIAEGLAAA